MNKTSNLNKNTKAKPVTPRSYEYSQVGHSIDSFGHSPSYQVHNQSSNSSYTSANDRQDAIRNGGSSNSTTFGTIPKAGKEKRSHSGFRTKDSDNAFPKSYEDTKPKSHFSYGKSYNDDGRGKPNQLPTKSPLQGGQSFSKSYRQGKKGSSVDSDSLTETTHQPQQQQQQQQPQQPQQQPQQGNHKGKLFTQPFVPQPQYQNGQHRHYVPPGGRQQQQQQQQPQAYYSSGTKYQATSPIITVGQSPVSIHVHPHSVSYTSTSHHGHYSISQTTDPTSPQPIHPQLSPSLPAPSAPIPIPHSWTAPGIPHYYAVPSPVYDSQQMQYHQYHPQYHHQSPHSTTAYTYYPNQSLPTPAPQPYQHQQTQPTSPLIHQKSPSHTYTAQAHPPQHVSPSAKTQPRTSKAIPIINPDTMAPVHADIPPGHHTAGNSDNTSSSSIKNNNGKKDEKPPILSAPTQFIDPAIKEQEERELQEREELERQQQAEKKRDDDIMTATTIPDDVASSKVIGTTSTSDLQNAVEITSIGSKLSPNTKDLTPIPDPNPASQHNTSFETTTTLQSTDNKNSKVDTSQQALKLSSSSSLEGKDGEMDGDGSGVIQYDPAFLMQFMPLCLDTAEDLSSFQNIGDSGDQGRHNNGGDKRQHFGNTAPDRNNTFRPNGGSLGNNTNNNNKNYSRSAPGGISILANQISSTTHYQGREGRTEMGKFIGGRTLTGRNNTTNTTTSSNINNLINASINNATAFGGNSGDSTKMQRDGSFGGRTKYTTGSGMPLCGRGPPINNNNNTKRHAHHEYHHQHHHHHHHQHGAPTIPLDQVAPLEKSANRWIPSVVAGTTTAAVTTSTTSANEDGILSQEEITRKIKALLNKLTLERFDTISDRIIGYAEQSTKEDDGQSLRTVIQLIFEKACDEAAFASMWAQLCRKLYEWIPADIKDVNTKDKNGEPVSGIPLYCKYLFSRCQYEFEKGWKSLPTPETTVTTTTTEGDGSGSGHHDGDDGNIAASDDGDVDTNLQHQKKKHVGAPGEAMMTDEYYTAVKIKRQGLGLVQFIGELYCRDMLSQRIMYQCLKRLCDSGAHAQEEEVESLCKLLTTIGADIDRDPQTATWFEVFFKRMQNEMYNSSHLTSRVRFMIMDVIDLRKNNWVPRHGKQDKPKTIAEIHEDAERAKILEKEALAKRSGSSRGGVSGGPLQANHYGSGGAPRQNYRTNGKPMKKGGGSGSSMTNDGNWNTTNNSGTGPSSISRHHDIPDYSNFGRTERARPRNNNLAPSYSPFASLNRSSDDSSQKSTLRRKTSSNLNDSPSTMSNKTTGSTNNMFSALGEDHIDEAERKKLTLLPRGSTLPRQHATTATGSEQKQITSANKHTGSSFNSEQLKCRIKNTLAEYYELVDIEELFTSIKELDHPETEGLLSMELLAVVEMKEKQVILAGELIPNLYKADILGKHVLVKAFQEFMHHYEDLVIDVPQAPTYVARLLVQAGIGLSEACADLHHSSNSPHSTPPISLQQAYTAMLPT
ncbi:MIF4G domain-domain-containing protein [Absidia repens]|uniref:MIF4G domain-domain-containing protein n=1 Tax=Absidia repens TaxID=90262 RepID=A0A1X2IEE2_9FUNG|nr:MIF4G domain-domain-containing protein [Absidia repens]